jgi:hypothetical protein
MEHIRHPKQLLDYRPGRPLKRLLEGYSSETKEEARKHVDKVGEERRPKTGENYLRRKPWRC